MLGSWRKVFNARDAHLGSFSASANTFLRPASRVALGFQGLKGSEGLVLFACSKRSGKQVCQNQARILSCAPHKNKQWDDCSWMKTREQFIFTLLRKMSYDVPELPSENNGCNHCLRPNGNFITRVKNNRVFTEEYYNKVMQRTALPMMSQVQNLHSPGSTQAQLFPSLTWDALCGVNPWEDPSWVSTFSCNAPLSAWASQKASHPAEFLYALRNCSWEMPFTSKHSSVFR